MKAAQALKAARVIFDDGEIALEAPAEPPHHELPVLTKAMLMEHFDEVVTDRRMPSQPGADTEVGNERAARIHRSDNSSGYL
jgi:hypothetical protein